MKIAFDPESQRLIAEAQRLRDELLRTTAKLDAFSDDLTEEVKKLRAEAGLACPEEGEDA